MSKRDDSPPIVAAPNAPPARLNLILGASEMAEHIRSYPWSVSPLGALEDWPATLITMVNLILSVPVAAALYWGPDLLFFGNDESVRMLGLTPAESLGLPAELLWGRNWSGIEQRLRAVLRSGESFHGESVPFSFKRSGKPDEVFVNYSLSPIYHEGKVAGVFRTLQETTDTVMAMRALAESDARLRMALSVGNCVGVWDWHIQTGMVYGDETIAGFYGLDPQAAAAGVNHLMYERMLHPEDIVLLTDAIMDCIKTGRDYSVDYRVRRADGSYGLMRSMGRCVYDENGHACRVTGVKLDVTGQKAGREGGDPQANGSESLFSSQQQASFPSHVTSFVTATANLLASRPSDVSLKVNGGGAETHFTLQVAESDLGNFIGRQGRIMRAIRTLLYTVAVKCNHRFYIDVEPNKRSNDLK